MTRKKPTQKTLIFSFLEKNPNVNAKIIAESLHLNFNSVRGRISELRKEKLLTPVRKDHTVETVFVSEPTKKQEEFFAKVNQIGKEIPTIIFYRKIAKATMYCAAFGSAGKHQKNGVFAITYENNKINRFTELVAAAYADKASKNCHVLDDTWGYDDQKRNPSPPFTYPMIEVESEF